VGESDFKKVPDRAHGDGANKYSEVSDGRQWTMDGIGTDMIQAKNQQSITVN